MVSEDFSFPKIKNPLPQFTSLPSLWRVSSLAYPEYGDDDGEEKEDDAAERQVLSFQRKSFSTSYLLESESNKRDMEKMDMLWEEFNEELKRVSSLRSSRISESEEARVIYKFKAEPSREQSLELYNDKPQPQPQPRALNMSKPNIGSGVIYDKRQTKSMLVVMKSLKNIFYLRNLLWVKN